MLPESRGNTYIARVVSIYTDLFRDKYGFHPQIVYGRFGKSLKKLMENHTELQVAALLIVFFNWRGITGDDRYEEQRVIASNHNPQWFFSTVNTYESYLRNVFGLEFDDESKVKSFVGNYMIALKNK